MNRMRAIGCLVLCGAGVFACSGEGNTGRTEIGDALAEMVPWVRGRAPVVGADGRVVVPDEPVYPDIATGKVDPGSGPYDCTQTEGLEFSDEYWLETFEADPEFNTGLGTAVGVAPAWSSYDDSSEGVFRMPAELAFFEGLMNRHGAIWGLPAEKVEGAPRCGEEDNDWVLHFRGGRFNRFGGGLGHPLAEECNLEGARRPGWCARTVDEEGGIDNAGFPLTAEDGSTYNPPVHEFIDVSDYDGLSFWARRGPESEAAVGVVIFDKYSSEDLNRQNETYCRRLKACRTQCINRKPCSLSETEMTVSDEPIYRCFDPEEVDVELVNPVLLEEVYPRCGKSACTYVSDYADPEFEGKECRPYTFQSNESGEFCWDEGDPPPPEKGERCGDGYGLQVIIGPDWEFHKVPFKEMRQFGHGKPQPELDLSTAAGIAIVTSKGWIDIYLDNVSFYREVD